MVKRSMWPREKIITTSEASKTRNSCQEGGELTDKSFLGSLADCGSGFWSQRPTAGALRSNFVGQGLKKLTNQSGVAPAKISGAGDVAGEGLKILLYAPYGFECESCIENIV